MAGESNPSNVQWQGARSQVSLILFPFSHANIVDETMISLKKKKKYT